MHITSDVLLDALRREGMRITRPRRAVCEVLAEAHDEHLSAADIAARARITSGVSVDPSTVYRTLTVLEALGMIRHVHLGHGPGAFHLTDSVRHHHLVCERCGRSVDVPLDDLQPALRETAERHDFDAATLHFALSGICRTCAASELEGPHEK